MPNKGCVEEDKIETSDAKGCHKFVGDQIVDFEKILTRLEEVHLMLLGEKLLFGIREVSVVGHMCCPYGRKPSMEKLEAIQKRKKCANTIEVQRFF